MAETITQAELDALPEMGGFDTRIEERNGKQVMIPVLRRPVYALWNARVVYDIYGHRWMLGEHNGTIYKSRMSDL